MNLNLNLELDSDLTLNGYDAENAPSQIVVEYPTTVSIYSDDDPENDLSLALAEEGTLSTSGDAPKINAFYVVKLTSGRFKAVVKTEPWTTVRVEYSVDSENWTDVFGEILVEDDGTFAGTFDCDANLFRARVAKNYNSRTNFVRVYELRDYDESNEPEAICVEWPRVVAVYSLANPDEEISATLEAQGKLFSVGTPEIIAFDVVNEVSTTTATIETEPETETLVEYSSDASEWTSTTLETDASGTATTTVDGTPRFFRTKIASSYGWNAKTSKLAPNPHVWLSYANVAQAFPIWTITKLAVPMSKYFCANETAIFLARIEESLNGLLLLPDDVETITYSAYKINRFGTNEAREPVPGHENVDVPVSAILTELETNDWRWNEKVDERGYNFRFEPDTRENPIFPEKATYKVVFTIVPKEGNPAPLVYSIKTT